AQMPIFESLRVSLSFRSQPSLFDISAAKEPRGSREAFFRFAFLERHDFTYWKRKYSYIPIGSDEAMFAGIVGREISELVHGGPDTGFELTETEKWQIAFVFFEVKTQIVSIQRNNRVGQPRRLL